MNPFAEQEAWEEHQMGKSHDTFIIMLAFSFTLFYFWLGILG